MDKTITQWPVYSLKEAYAERGPVQYLVERLIRLPSLTIVYGPPACLKSLLVADMCGAIVAGQPWLPGAAGAGFATLQAGVLWVDFDNGERESHDRFAALGHGYSLPDSAPLYYCSMALPWLDLSSERHALQLELLLDDLKVQLVVVDNLGVVEGNVQENSAAMTEVMAHLRLLAERVAVIVIHHQRKGRGDNGGRAGDSLRGHSCIEAAVDLALLVERRGESDKLTVRATKVRTGPGLAPVPAVFTCTRKAGGQELASTRFYGSTAERQLPAEDLAVRTAVLESVRKMGEPNKTQLLKQTAGLMEGRLGERKISDVIKAMIAEGQLCVESGPHHSMLISLPPDDNKVTQS